MGCGRNSRRRRSRERMCVVCACSKVTKDLGWELLLLLLPWVRIVVQDRCSCAKRRIHSNGFLRRNGFEVSYVSSMCRRDGMEVWANDIVKKAFK
jgi:hypothetical protein